MRLSSLPLALVLLFAPRAANATPGFPDVIAEHLQLASAPSCALCHAGTQARGTVTTPFGVTIRSRGAQAYDDDSLRTALDALAAEGKDSDADGTPDIEELKAGTDPNGTGEAVVPEYGCASAPATSHDAFPAFAPVALAALAARALAALRRKRDGHRRG